VINYVYHTWKVNLFEFYPMHLRSSPWLCLAFLLAAASMMAACTAKPAALSRQTLTPGPTQSILFTPLPGKGSLRGVVVNASETWPDMDVIYIFAAPFSGDASGKGMYFLDPSIHPQAILEAGGGFHLDNLTPQRYVLVVGPQADASRPLLDELGKTRIVEVKAGELLQLGQVKVSK
jgi:hypothetical protein